MHPHQPEGRQRGQVAILMALALTGLLGVTGVAIDLGFGYAHHRQVQNAAESAARAGALGLSRHYTAAGATSAPGIITDPYDTDARILAEISTAAAASVPPFPDPNLGPPEWPAGPGNNLVAYYVLTNGTVLPMTGGSPPSTAAGVRVELTYSSPTIFAKVLGDCCTQVRAFGSARAMLRPVGSYPGSAPFIVCGGGSGSYGAFVIKGPDQGRNRNILDTSVNPPAILSQYVGQTLLVHGPRLGPNTADCGHEGANFKGNSDATDTCNPVGTAVMPCLLKGTTGTEAGPTRGRVAGLPGCAPAVTNTNSSLATMTGCVLILPVANGMQDTEFRIVTYVAMYVLAGPDGVPDPTLRALDVEPDQWECPMNGSCHSGRILGAALIEGAAGEGVFDPTKAGTFTVESACDPPDAPGTTTPSCPL